MACRTCRPGATGAAIGGAAGAAGGYLWSQRMEEQKKSMEQATQGTGVAVTVVFPGVVATGIRLRGYGPDGKPAGKSGLKEEGAMSTEECARQTIAALRARRRELVMTAKGKVGVWLKLIAPGLVDRMAQAALKKEA